MNGVRLWLEHPRIPSCAVCQAYMVDYDFHNGTGTGEIVTYKGPSGEEFPDKRPPGVPTPCKRCPKRGPQHEHEHVLSPRNIRALNFYRGHKATWGNGLREAASDPLVQETFAILDDVFSGHEQSRLGRTVARAVSDEIARLFRR